MSIRRICALALSGLSLCSPAAFADEVQMASVNPHPLTGNWNCTSLSDADGDVISGVWTAHYGPNAQFSVDFEGSWERADRPGEMIRWAVKSQGKYRLDGQTLTEQNTSFNATPLPPIGFDERSRVQGEAMTKRLVTYLNSDFSEPDVSDIHLLSAKSLQYGTGNSCIRMAEAES